jgi:hypothetical protein
LLVRGALLLVVVVWWRRRRGRRPITTTCGNKQSHSLAVRSMDKWDDRLRTLTITGSEKAIQHEPADMKPQIWLAYYEV